MLKIQYSEIFQIFSDGHQENKQIKYSASALWPPTTDQMYSGLQNLTARRCFEYSYVSKNEHRQAYDYGHIVCAASCCQWLELSFSSLETGLWIMGPLSILAQTGPLAFSQPPTLSQVLILSSSWKQVSFK